VINHLLQRNDIFIFIILKIKYLYVIIIIIFIFINTVIIQVHKFTVVIKTEPMRKFLPFCIVSLGIYSYLIYLSSQTRTSVN
jgi:hypothetical protein